MKNRRLVFIVFALIFFAGCGPVDQETINEVLTKDPSFSSVLKEKNRNNEKILSLQAEFNKEKDKILNDIIIKRDNLKTKEVGLEIEVKDTENIEEETIKIYSEQNPSHFNKLIPQLINTLSIEKQEGETTDNFTNRLMEESKKILRF